jgi:hypothetical protein
MQRSLNYITAELRMRETGDLALAQGSRNNVSGEGKEDEKLCDEINKDSGNFQTSSWIRKKDGDARIREMEDADKRWEKESCRNPRWGEGRTAHLYGK